MSKSSKRQLEAGENPLSRADYQAILEGERVLHDTLPLIESAEACGMECQAFREIYKFTQDKFAALKQHFFTPPPGEQ